MSFRQLAFAALTLSLCGCAATSLKQTWKSPTCTGGPVQRIAVLGVDEREFYRASVEGHFVFQLNQHGQSAFVTHDLLDLAALKADKPAAAASLRARGADALLIVRLVSSTSSASAVSATPDYYAPVVTGYENDDWQGYYSVAFMNMGTVWSSAQRKVCLDTSLFDLKSGKRLWSGITQTVLKDDVDRVEELSALVTKVLAAMRKDGLVR